MERACSNLTKESTGNLISFFNSLVFILDILANCCSLPAIDYLHLRNRPAYERSFIFTCDSPIYAHGLHIFTLQCLRTEYT